LSHYKLMDYEKLIEEEGLHALILNLAVWVEEHEKELQHDTATYLVTETKRLLQALENVS